MITVLDHGYVRVVDVMGDELRIVNAARASYGKEHAEFTEQDAKLLRYLWTHGHMSPFRHVVISVEVKAPLEVARQLWKYVVGSDHTMETSWNEESYRYVAPEAPEFYIPQAWRYKSATNKQGSEGILADSTRWQVALEAHHAESVAWYHEALHAGIAPEMARLFLPAYGLYTTWRWTASLQAVLHVIEERTAPGAQWEIQQYAAALRALILPRFPVMQALLAEDSHSAREGGGNG